VQNLHGADQVHRQMGAEKLQVGKGQVLSPMEVQKLLAGNPQVLLQMGAQKLMVGNEQVHLLREPENLQVCIGQVVRAQRLIRPLVPAKAVNRLVTKRLHQQAGTLWKPTKRLHQQAGTMWKPQRDRETVIIVLLSGTKLSETLGNCQRDREMATRMQVGERI